MLAFDLAFDDDASLNADGSASWLKPAAKHNFYRAASVGGYGVTSIGRGFDWENESPTTTTATMNGGSSKQQQQQGDSELNAETREDPLMRRLHSAFAANGSGIMRPVTNSVALSSSSSYPLTISTNTSTFIDSPISSRPSSPFYPSSSPSTSRSHVPPRTPTSARSSRRSSQQRVSLIAGRVSIAPLDDPASELIVPPGLHRTGSTSSYLSLAATTAPPSPAPERQSFLGGRSISEFVIEGDLGRGAYGLVKLGREILSDGSLGPQLAIKQVIKQRILADCWKKHPKHGTIPIEIYVMSAISNTSYILPARRPWDPCRFDTPEEIEERCEWRENVTVKGHPNICPLLDFFEDDHYYYLILPSTKPPKELGKPNPPGDLFDLVEAYPRGLSPRDIRTYLGQMADAVCFLHSHGIVHRDLKDENVVLGQRGKCILIDFGSSGLVKKGGWDTFSGTLDYAGPEILRGERYQGKEQDVWAFGVVAYVLLVGECPFQNAAEAQEGMDSPFSNACIALDERCSDDDDNNNVEEEKDGGGRLVDAARLVRECLRVDVGERPTFERILQCRFLCGEGGW